MPLRGKSDGPGATGNDNGDGEHDDDAAELKEVKEGWADEVAAVGLSRAGVPVNARDDHGDHDKGGGDDESGGGDEDDAGKASSRSDAGKGGSGGVFERLAPESDPAAQRRHW